MGNPVRALAAAALLVCSASGSGAYEFRMSVNPASVQPSEVLVPGDEVIVDVYMDAEPGLVLLAIPVTFDDDGILVYVPDDSLMPFYILYTPNVGAQGARWLDPYYDPPRLWPGTNLPGKQQVNLDYGLHQIGIPDATALGSGANVWLGSLVFHVADQGDGTTTLDLNLGATAAYVIVGAENDDVTSESSATGSFVFSVPEPVGALSLGSGAVMLAVLAWLRRRRVPAR